MDGQKYLDRIAAIAKRLHLCQRERRGAHLSASEVAVLAEILPVWIHQSQLAIDLARRAGGGK